MIASEKVEKYIKEMSHFDPDNMQMGAKEIKELVISGQLDLENNTKMADQIRLAFLKQMQSDNFNVHAHAIRCVADMVPQLPSQQIEAVFSKIISSIVDRNLIEKKRQIYGVCAGTVIHKAAEQHGSKLSDLFVQSIKQLMKLKDEKNEIESMLINVISQFMRKWPNIAGDPKLNYDRKNLVLYLLGNVELKSSLELIKKSETALGKLTLVLHLDHLKILFDDPKLGLILFLKNNIGKNSTQSSIKNLRNGLLCLSQVMKTHNSEIKYWAHTITNILVQIIKIYKQDKDIEHVDFTCDILESSITSLSYTIKSYSRQLKDILDKPINCLNDFVEELIDFNLQGLMNYMNGHVGMIEQNYEGQQFDYDDNMQADEKCWKVRSAIINYITYLVKKDKHFKDKISKSDEFINKLGYKLIEQNPIVVQTALQTFNTLIQSISISQNTTDQQQQLSLVRIKSNEFDLIQNIINQIISNIKIILNSSYNDKIKIESSRLLLKVVKLYHEKFQQKQEIINKLLIILQQQIKNTNIIENKYNLILTFKYLINPFYNFKKYQNVLEFICNSLLNQQQNFKIISSSYKCINCILTTFFKQVKSSNVFNKIIQLIKNKLDQSDADRIIKNSVMKCLAPLFKFMPLLTVENQQELLNKAKTRLKAQIQKTVILEQITYLSTEFRPNSKCIEHIKEMISLTVQNLGNVNYNINSYAIKSTEVLLKILGSSLNDKIVENVLKQSNILFNESKIPSYIYYLLPNYPKMFKNYSQILIKTADYKCVSQMIQLKIINVEQCVSVLSSGDKSEKNRKISRLLGQIGVSKDYLINKINQSNWGKICVGALGYIGDESIVKILIDIIYKNKNEELKFQAANALGNICSRNHNKIIEIILDEINKGQQQYIFIYVIKEMLNYLQDTNNLQKLINELFNLGQKKYQGQSIYYIISECIGKICIKSSIELQNILKNKIHSQRSKFIFASSLRFSFEDLDEIQFNQSLSHYIQTVMKLLSDQSIQVRYTATKSLNTIANNHKKFIKPYLNNTFWKCLLQNSQINQKLIIIVDYGISKQKKDTGKPLRLESFNLLKLLIKNITDNGIIEQIIKICLDKLDLQNNTDIILKRLNIIKLICQIDFTYFISFQDELFLKLNIDKGLLLQYKNNISDQRGQIYLKNIFKQLIEISNISLKENIDQVRSFINSLKSIPKFAKLIDSLEN